MAGSQESTWKHMILYLSFHRLPCRTTSAALRPMCGDIVQNSHDRAQILALWTTGATEIGTRSMSQSQKLRNPYMFLSKWLDFVGKSLMLQTIILRDALCWNVNFEGDWRGRFSDLIWGLGLSPCGSWTKCSMACNGLESLVPRTFGLAFRCLINVFPIFEQ